MNTINNLFWEATLPELKQGYRTLQDQNSFQCLICSKQFETGVIYPQNGKLHTAEKAIQTHIVQEHKSMFDYLLGLDDKIIGITPHQKKLLNYFHQGLSDQKIVDTLQKGSTSTIRNYRFQFKERQKQAKLFLALTELLHERKNEKERFIPLPLHTTIIDERFAITEKEYAGYIKKYFSQGEDGPIATWPKQEKRRVAILLHTLNRFDATRRYTEKEVNAILTTVYEDYAHLRRNLIDYGIMDRKADGSQYWIKP